MAGENDNSSSITLDRSYDCYKNRYGYKVVELNLKDSGTRPLYVVDGKEVDNLTLINPPD